MIVKFARAIAKQCVVWFLQYLSRTRPLLIHAYANSHQNHDNSWKIGLKYALQQSSNTSSINVIFNGKSMIVPTHTLLTMTHCITLDREHIICQVEQKHFMWLYEQVQDCTGRIIFIDIGSASGAAIMTLAPRISKLYTIAFEPSKKARGLLERMLSANGYSSVEIYPYAVSDINSQVPFIEYGLIDEAPAYRPETSSLFIPNEIPPDAQTYEVECVTLDYIFSINAPDFDDKEQILIKIDVEGFECHVLRGAEKFITKYRPYLAIDIHSQPENSSETTLKECSRLLKNMDYSLQIIDHVLVARSNASRLQIQDDIPR